MTDPGSTRSTSRAMPAPALALLCLSSACAGATATVEPDDAATVLATGGAAPERLATFLLDVECWDVLETRGPLRWRDDAVVVRGRLPEPDAYDVALPLADAVRAGLPLVRLPPSGNRAPCRVGRPAQGSGGTSGGTELADFLGGVMHLWVERARGLDDGTVEVDARLVADFFGTRQRLGARYVLAREGGADPARLRVLRRRSWLERSTPSASEGPTVTYDARFFEGIDLGAERAVARGDVACAVSRLREGRRFDALITYLDAMDAESRFPYWSTYVHAAEVTGRFLEANAYREWVAANTDERAARRAAVGGLVDRCLKDTEGEPHYAGAFPSDGPCSPADREALADGDAPEGLYCHPPPEWIAGESRRIRAALDGCVEARDVAYEAVAVLDEGGATELGRLARVVAPGAPSEGVSPETSSCVRAALAGSPRAPFRLRRAADQPRNPIWIWRAELLVP